MKTHYSKIFMILIGNIMIAWSLITFILPHNIMSAGVSGVGFILQNLFQIPLSLTVLCLNIILFIIAYLLLGYQFALKSLLSTFCFPMFLAIFETLPLSLITPSPLISALCGGMFIGLGAGFILRSDATSGGLDVISVILKKHFNIPIHFSLYVFDLMIILLQLLYNDFHQIVYGMIVVLSTSLVIKFMTQYKSHSSMTLTLSKQQH